MSRRLLGFTVNSATINRMLMECATVIAVQNVVEAGRMCESENTVPRQRVSMRFFATRQGTLYEGSNLGAQTMATLSGIMT